MRLPRYLCPRCDRPTAVTLEGGMPHRFYRHDPRGGRTPDLKSCPGSLKLVEDEGRPVLFTADDLEDVQADDGAEQPGLF